MKNIFYIVLGIIFFSCSNKRERNYQYMPDMYKSEAYETYDKSPLKPVEGTISRGEIPYELPNTNEGYEKSKSLENPISNYYKNVDEGKKLYNIYCAVCHGESGDGQGTLVKNEKFFGVPNFKNREINDGSIFHVVTYGRGVMGSHSSQLTQKERWKIARFVMKLKNK